jgi:hypothetical protein
MSNISKDLYVCLEILIKDESKKSKNFNGSLESLNHHNSINFESLTFYKPGHIEYYGFGYELFGAKDLAFYKSSNSDIYIIESLNGVPYRHHKVI